MFMILKKWINKIGWPITNKDIVVLTYGGLRGAIALSLGLIIAFDEELDPRFRDLIIFYVISMISLTVMFNGLTIKYVMKKIGFKDKNPIHKKIKLGIQK